MGGIGKTTLAKAVFRQISPQFRGHCCFLEDVRSHDIINLQKKLLSDVLNVSHTNPSMIKTRFRSKKVLIVLDDINNRNQIMRLAREASWFGGGSRIIITTRNIEFLVKEGEDDNLSVSNSKQFSFYDMLEMNSDDALQLFCERALGCATPPPDYMDITKKLINALGGLPLALDVIGSTLHKKCRHTWEQVLRKLKKVMNEDVKKKLMISYEELEPNQQQIYLDIACLFFDEEKTTVVKYWDAIYGYPTEIEVKVLKHMSLIKISSYDKLWMHDQLRDLGRNIVDLESGEVHMRGSRLWSPKDAFGVVESKTGTKDIVALNLGTPHPNKAYRFKRKQFAGLGKLRFLQLDHGNFEGDFKNVFSELRWLSWSNCPSKFQATNFGLKNLTILRLSGSNITKDWGGWRQIMVATQLKILELEDCPFLRKTPKFSTILQLEKLILRCTQLRKIDKSIGKLQQLDYLEIKSESIESLPKSMGGLKSLTVLRIDQEPSRLLHSIGNLAKKKHLILLHGALRKLPDSIGRLRSLVELDLSFSKINELPHSIGNLERLKVLCCEDCHLEKLPDSIGRLQSLLKLNIIGTKISELPHSIGNLERLEILDCSARCLENLPNSIGRLQSLVELDLSFTKIKILPNCIGNLKKLKVLKLSRSHISELPKTIGMLENLEELYAHSEYLEGELPSEIGALSSLDMLDLSGGCFSELPATINRLSNLQTLTLLSCNSIQRLPELPKSLKELYISSKSLTTVPDFSNLTNLGRLKIIARSVPNVEGIVRLRALWELILLIGKVAYPPIDFSSLSQLRSLSISCVDSRSLTRLPSSLEYLSLEDVQSPIDFSSLSQLRSLFISCVDSRSLTRLPSSLEYLSLEDVQSPIDWSILSNLENLSKLNIRRYSLGEIRFEVPGKLRKFKELWMENCPLLKTVSVQPSLKEIRRLHLEQLPQLTEIQGLGELKSLWCLGFSDCNSIKSLNESDLSNLWNLKSLYFTRCESLESVLGVPKSCELIVNGCPRFNRDGKFREPLPIVSR
ncbi:hypothetical protein BT93_K2187 [Corymbia citriodora subsp. variegata]|nr:hypothetical protein BT93_K2187 [Corymbia citriodora subsp. variegata]KAF8008440.1 hypothetical protein BT93_K2187 [Corymbia citriodora subsp. variegata]KAF8008441.1 hypothetical protein BT93_K2187 [Corymbia citriodora subsp. variegata]KAF8008442.1 hypothetical protein BT93_K2187 [Corymbia citriodora subsp. variegata]